MKGNNKDESKNVGENFLPYKFILSGRLPIINMFAGFSGVMLLTFVFTC